MRESKFKDFPGEHAPGPPWTPPTGSIVWAYNFITAWLPTFVDSQSRCKKGNNIIWVNNNNSNGRPKPADKNLNTFSVYLQVQDNFHAFQRGCSCSVFTQNKIDLEEYTSELAKLWFCTLHLGWVWSCL